MCHQSERKKNAASGAKNKADNPEPAKLRQSRDRCNRDRDLKHGHTPGVDLVLVKIVGRFLL